MVKTVQERRPWHYDEDGKRKPSIYVCGNCGKVEKGRFPNGWIGAIPLDFCSFKCYSEDRPK